MQCNGLDKYKKGDFNSARQQSNADGTVTLTLTSRKYPTVYKFQVKDLYKSSEQVTKILSGD